MATSLLNNLIDRYLSNIVEINKEETKLSLWSGTLEMHNLKFKREIFDTLNLPYLELVNGYIGKIKVTLSLPRFYLYPMHMEISEVFFHARQKNITKLNRDKEIKLIESYKNSKLKSKEELSADITQLTNESPGILNQILHNLNIKITNVVFRLEDDVSFPNHPFSFGILLSNAFIESVVEQGNDNENQQQQFDVSQKLIKINNLSIYLDSKEANEDISYHSLIDPSEREQVENKQGKYLRDLIDFYAYGWSEISVHSNIISSHQYILYQLNMELKLLKSDVTLYNCLPRIYYNISFPYIQCFISIIQIQTFMRVIGYIHLKTLYQVGICKEYYTKQLSITEKQKYIMTYKKYYQCKYIQGYINDKEANELSIQLSSIEDGINYQMIKSIRSSAMSEINHIKTLEDINKQIETIEGKWFISSSYKESELCRFNEIKAKIIKEQSKLKANEDDKENKDKEVSLLTEESNNNRIYLIIFSLKQFDVIFKETPIKKIALFTLNNFDIEVTLQRISKEVSISLGELSLVQYLQSDNSVNNTIISTHKTDDSNSKDKVLQLFYGYSPQYTYSNNRLIISNQKPLDIILNYYILMYLYKSINTSLKETIYFSELNAYVQEEVIKYIKKGYVDTFLSGNYGYFNIDFDIKLICPTIILPITPNKPNTKISLGFLKLDSLLFGDQSDYDEYIVELNGVKVVIGKESEEDYELIPISNGNMSIKTQKDKSKVNVDHYIIKVNLPKLQITISEMLINYFINVVDTTKRSNIILNKQFPKEDKVNECFDNKNIIKQYIKDMEQQNNIGLLNEDNKPIALNKSESIVNKACTTDANAIRFLFNVEVVELEILKTIKEDSNDTDKTSSKKFIHIALSNISIDFKAKVNTEIVLDLYLSSMQFDHYANQNLCQIIQTKSIVSKDKTEQFLHFYYSNNNDTNSIDITIKPMSLDLHFNSLCLIYKFILFYLRLYQLNGITIENENRIENLNEEYNEFVALKREAKTDKEINKNFMQRLKENRLNQSRKQHMIDEKTKPILSSIDKILHPTNSNQYNSKSKISFTMQSIEMRFYYDSYLIFQLKTGFSFIQSSDYLIETISSSLTNKTLYVNYQRKNDKITMSLSIMSFGINHYHEKHSTIILLLNPLITNYIISYSQVSFINLATHSQVTKIEISDTPLVFSIDLKQIHTVKSLIEEIPVMKQEFYTNYEPEYPLKDIKALNRTKASLSSLMNRKSFKEAFQMKVHYLRDLIEYERMYNIAQFANYYDVSVILKGINLKLNISNTNTTNCLINASLKDIAFKYIHNSDPSDGTNLANFLIEMITRKDIAMKCYDAQQLYHYVFAAFELEGIYYNKVIKQWESLIEPWKVEVKGMQIGASTKKRVQITSDTMLNANISLNAIKAMSSIIKHYNKIQSKIIKRFDEVSKEEEEVIDTQLILINSSGVEVKFWFGLLPKEKYTLVSGNESTLSKSQLNASIENNVQLNEEEVKLLFKQNNIINVSICNTKPISFDINFDYCCYCPCKIINNCTVNEYDIVLKAKWINDNTYSVSFGSNISFCNRTIFDNLLLTNTNSTLTIPLPINKQISIPISILKDDSCSYYISSQSNEKTKQLLYSQIAEVTEVSNKNKGKIILLDKDTYVSLQVNQISTSNVIYLSSNNDIEEDSKMKIDNAVYYEIEITPTVIIYNETPFSLSINSSLSQTTNIINSLEKKDSYNIDPSDTKKHILISFDVNKQNFKSDSIVLNSSLLSIVLYNQNHKEQIECKVKSNEHNNHKEFYSIDNNQNQLSNIYSQSSSISLTLYFPYLYLNKTNTLLEFKSSSSTDQYQLKPMSYNVFGFKDKSVLIKTDKSDWSEPINITAINNKSIVKLKQSDNSLFFKTNQSLYPSSFSTMISKGKPYYNSSLIIIDKRYVIINQLDDISIDYKQSEPNDNTYYNLQYKDEKELIYSSDSRLYQIRIHDKANDKDASLWSNIFNVDGIDSSDVKLKCNDKSILSKVPSANLFSNADDNIHTQYILIRVLIKTLNQGTTYILFTFPQYPNYQIENKSSLSITIREFSNDSNHKSLSSVKINSGLKSPLVLSSTNISHQNLNKLQCKIGNDTIPFSFNKLGKTKVNQYVLRVYLDNNSTKTMVISEKRGKNKAKKHSKVSQQLFTISQGLKLKVCIKGIGISILNSAPKELFYISVYGIDCLYNSNATIVSVDNKKKSFESLRIYIKNIQIDDCSNANLKICLFVPKLQMIPQNEESILNKAASSKETIVPFIQMLINKETITIHNVNDDSNSNNNPSMSKIRQLDFAMQEFNVFIDQNAIDQYLSIYKKVVNLNLIDEEIINDNKDTVIRDIELKQQSVPYLLLQNQMTQTSMLIIDYLLLSAIKCNLTIRLDINALDLGYLPQVLRNVINAVGNSISKISNLPLRYNECIYENVFVERGKMLSLLQEYYLKSTLKQIYKVLGYNDLIGNPLQLIENIGTGFFELVNEPRKGFIQGADQFGKGLEKGIQSFVSNVIGGGFASISAVSGSLLSASKNLQGNKGQDSNTNENKPANIKEGAIKGLKEGFDHLSSGITGIVTNPYKNAKEGGVIGFFKGVGEGLTKAVFCPITSALSVTTNITQGVSNSLSNEGSDSNLPKFQFRSPRVFKIKEAIMPFDHHFKGSSTILSIEEPSLNQLEDNLDKIKVLFNLPKDIEFLLNVNFHIIDKGLEGKTGILIITNNLIAALTEDLSSLLFKSQINKLYSCQMQFINSVYTLIFIKKNFKVKKLSLTESLIANKVKEIIKDLLTY